MWPLADGVLVERLADGDHYDGLPMLFSLLHPLDELCPVTCRAPTPSERTQGGGGHVCGHILYL